MRARWLPPEFDPGFYRKCKPYLADARNDVLEQEFKTYGLASGTPGSFLCYRENIKKFLDSVAGSILEIGPGGHPDFRGSKVKYLDILTTPQMRAHYGAEGNPPEIDYTVEELALQTIPLRFDAVYSAHNFEHQVNPLLHIASVSHILNPNGLFVAVIPDRNFTFDYFRPPSTLTDILTAPASHTEHGVKARLERFNHTHNNCFAHWFGNHGEREGTDEEILAAFTEETEAAFLSLHAGVYEPASFRRIFGLLSRRGLLKLELMRVYNTPFLRNEFVTLFRKPETTQATPTREQAMNEALKIWVDTVGRKPRVLILADVPGWAYDINSRGLREALSGEFDIDIAYLHHGPQPDLRPDYYDLYHVCCWVDLVGRYGIEKERFVKEVSSHRWEEPRYGSLSPRQFCEKHLSDSATITATSKRLQALIRPVRPCLLVPNGVSDAFSPPEEPRTGELIFGWAGNIDDSCKGLKDILLPGAYHLLDLRIAPGNVGHDAMADFYRDLDVICVASDREGEPLPLLEGMACGCFPLCTDVGIVPELIRNGENGLIVERTPEAFRRAFLWCRENADMVREAGRKNAELIRRTRGWDKLKGARSRAWSQALSLQARATARQRGEPGFHEPRNPARPPVIDRGLVNDTGAPWSFVSRSRAACDEGQPGANAHPPGFTASRNAGAGGYATNLSAACWHEAMVSSQNVERLAAAVLSGKSPVWLKQLLASTTRGQTCLELGSGTAALSAALALEGRKVLLLDFSRESLEFSKRLFRKLGLPATFIHADILTAIPLEDDSCDCVWSSGVLEHFGTPELTHIMGESARVARDTVISLVPNAASVPYRLGK